MLATDTSDRGFISKIYKELNITQHQADKQSNLKKGKVFTLLMKVQISSQSIRAF